MPDDRFGRKQIRSRPLNAFAQIIRLESIATPSLQQPHYRSASDATVACSPPSLHRRQHGCDRRRDIEQVDAVAPVPQTSMTGPPTPSISMELRSIARTKLAIARALAFLQRHEKIGLRFCFN